MRWNLSSRARALSGADAVVLSIPKSGRTWLRVFLSAYFARKTDQPFSINITEQRSNGVPRIVYSHDRFEHRTKGRWWDRVRGKYLLPLGQVSSPIILLARDPRDTFVSYAVQLARRNPGARKAVRTSSTSELLRNPRFGIRAVVDVLNTWIREFGSRNDFALVRYEDLHAEPIEAFSLLLHAIGEKTVDSSAYEEALRFSSFDNMKRLEASGSTRDKILAPGNRNDPESFKVRRGEVGAFVDYLSPADQEFAARVCERLNPIFGYSNSSGVLGRFS